MSVRITFNVKSPKTMQTLDEYCQRTGMSRSQLISTLLDATTPILNDINVHYQLAHEMESRLMAGVYRRDLQRKRNVVSAEKYCREIWENKLVTLIYYDFDSSNGRVYAREHKRHNRTGKHLGKIEGNHIKELCERLFPMAKEGAKYAFFIYTSRHILCDKEDENSNPVRFAAGDAKILLVRDVIFDDLFFDISKAFYTKTIDLMSSGVNGIPQVRNVVDNVYCWVPILFSGDNVLLTPVYRIDPLAQSIRRKPDRVTIVFPVNDN